MDLKSDKISCIFLQTKENLQLSTSYQSQQTVEIFHFENIFV